MRFCPECAAGRHTTCLGSYPTGRSVPDRDPYRDRTGWVPEYVSCECGDDRDGGDDE